VYFERRKVDLEADAALAGGGCLITCSLCNFHMRQTQLRVHTSTSKGSEVAVCDACDSL
jgi:hypothetical protein